MCTSLNFLLLLLLPAFSLPGFPTSFCSCWSRYSWRFVKAQSHFRRSLSKSLSWKGGKKPTLNIAPAKPRFPYCGWHISSTLLLILHPSRKGRQSRHIQILQLSTFYVKYFWLPPLQLFFCTTQLNKTSLYTVLRPQTTPKLTKHWSWTAQSSPLPSVFSSLMSGIHPCPTPSHCPQLWHLKMNLLKEFFSSAPVL